MPVHATLQQAFAERADGVQADGAPLVGVFGEGVPLPLVAALGGLAVDVKAPPLSDETEGPYSDLVASVTEPFLDPFTTRFLHRFAAGAFDRFATLLFARDDVAALAAYQYALELRRQGRVPGAAPRLHLWNLLHTDSIPAETFNRHELERLVSHLEETLATRLDHDRLSEAIEAEKRRSAALDALPPGGRDVFIARNAGRWMTPATHAALLDPLPRPRPSGPAIVLLGTACDIPLLHDLCAEFGQVRADIQDYGRRAPQPTGAADLLRDIVHDPLAPRAAPPARFTRALHDTIKSADLVIASLDTNDDSFGWDLPRLRDVATARGARFLNLGFRPFRPDEAWRAMARAGIAEALA
ncbi:2-hydroxyacyl-CoA dehydratase family protein [Maritimibacter sp. HL-12]|uniref:2-hydroxyacyl-CoA dehydratase family protein n=1 Tax=Maritimibacter sp. HL-12 TaxID=1162418 RepID=UPI000A0F21A2|nr:2-hydroxyacyl-CoA dehydratase family protein [Maritimibacter sp. HL-12]SMH38953.1 hypothetical protein SAMN05661107_0939 [Maritimibacter sp. HL-12]